MNHSAVRLVAISVLIAVLAGCVVAAPPPRRYYVGTVVETARPRRESRYTAPHPDPVTCGWAVTGPGTVDVMSGLLATGSTSARTAGGFHIAGSMNATAGTWSRVIGSAASQQRQCGTTEDDPA